MLTIKIIAVIAVAGLVIRGVLDDFANMKAHKLHPGMMSLYMACRLLFLGGVIYAIFAFG